MALSKNTIFSKQYPSEHGCEPQSPMRGSKPTRHPKNQENTTADEQAFKKKYNLVVLYWWPRYPNGRLVTHVYRLIDNDAGSDIRRPTFPWWHEDMGRNIPENTAQPPEDGADRNGGRGGREPERYEPQYTAAPIIRINVCGMWQDAAENGIDNCEATTQGKDEIVQKEQQQ